MKLLSIGLILFLTASCTGDLDSSRVSFIINNELSTDVSGKLYTVRDASSKSLRSDSLTLSVQAGSSISKVWTPKLQGDGEFQLFIDEESKQRFGYYTNGVILGDTYTITIRSDTVLVLSEQ